MLGTLSRDLNVARVPSQKIGRELEASSTGPMCKREPERSEGGHSQKIVPGLEAFNHVRNVKPGPERSEGPGGKAPRAFHLLLVLT